MSRVGCANRLVKKNGTDRDGSLIPVCGLGKAKVDSSVFMVSKGGIVKKGGKIDYDTQ